MEKRTPRIFFTLPLSNDPSVMRMVESQGLAIPVMWQTQLPEIDRLPHQFKTFEERAAEAFIRAVHPSSERCVAECRSGNVDGAILFTLFSCRPVSYPMHMHRKYIEEQLGIPVLVLEGDLYDTRTYSAEQLRTRVETFAEIVKARKAAVGK